MESTLIVSSVNPPKNSDVLISGRREGVKQDAKMSLFFMSLLWGGGRGSRQISQMSFNILFFLEGFPNHLLLLVLVNLSNFENI